MMKNIFILDNTDYDQMYINLTSVMCIACLGYLSFLPTSALASVLCTCISMYIHN